MARGWESKAVEAQIDSAAARVRVPLRGSVPDPAALEKIRHKEGLLLSRKRVLHELEAAQNPRYQAMLQKALADLDLKLGQFS